MDSSPDDFTGTSFDLGQCPGCDREVLTYPSLDDERPDRDTVRCVHCDSEIVDGIRTALGEDLPDFGYGLLELQGCGNPDCGGGQCSRMAQNQADGGTAGETAS